MSARGLVFFIGGDNDELWGTDGTPGGTGLLKRLDLPLSASTLPLVSAGGRAWFLAEDPTRGRELWSSDGTGAGLGGSGA